MNRWERLDRAEVPGGGGVMDLLQRAHELAIHVDGRELMNSRVHGSEDALADLAFDRIGDRPDAAVLIGGLGMGFTLAAAVRRLPPDGRAVVAELVPDVIRWSVEGPIGPVAGHPLRDPRASARNEDVGAVIRATPGEWDAILLDVDNGPRGLTRPGNDWLYAPEGLAASKRALRPGGVVAWWSAAPDDQFTRRLHRAGFFVEELTVRARGDKGGRRHTLWYGSADSRATARRKAR